MLRFRISLVTIAAGLCACTPSGEDSSAPQPDSTPAAAAQAPDAWQVLFDGGDLSRWNAVGDANWQIEGDAVRADSGNGYLVSDVDYGDFELSLDFFVNVEANSGVFIRCMDHETIGADSCYEINIFDTRPDQTYRTGAIVNYAEPAAIIYTGGRWNTYEISAQGPHLVVMLNHVKVVDIEDSTYSRGPIALQYGQGTVMFRNIRVRTP